MDESIETTVQGKEARLQQLSKLKQQARALVDAGQLDAAVVALRDAVGLDDRDAALWLRLAGLQRARGDHEEAAMAVERVLSIEPKSMLGLLMKGSLLERAGQKREAAVQYGRAIAQCPPGSRFDAATDKALAHAGMVYRDYLDALGRHVRHELAGKQTNPGGAEARRIDLFIDATLGVRRIYAQAPTEYCYPGLPAIEFHERDAFPWLSTLEAGTAAIRSELQELIATADDAFTPYVAYPDGVPLEQWAELNRSPRWSALHLFQRGQRVAANADRCPVTMSTLAALPQPEAPGRMPAAMFSLLRPGTRIPPHTGVANVRLVVHLPLIVPAGCGFRVGNETRVWREGEAWVFDDTIEHEAWNDSDQNRYVLIFDIWNPRLSATERELITAVMASMDRYNGVAPEGGL